MPYNLYNIHAECLSLGFEPGFRQTLVASLMNMFPNSLSSVNQKDFLVCWEDRLNFALVYFTNFFTLKIGLSNFLSTKEENSFCFDNDSFVAFFGILYGLKSRKLRSGTLY